MLYIYIIINGIIYHEYTPNVSTYIYIPYMDPMGINMQFVVS